MNETLTRKTGEPGNHATAPELVLQAGMASGRVALTGAMAPDTGEVAIDPLPDAAEITVIGTSPTKVSEIDGSGDGEPSFPGQTAEATGESHETVRLLDTLGDLLILRLIANSSSNPETFLRNIVPSTVALPTLPEVPATDEDLPDLLGYIVLGHDPEKNGLHSEDLRRYLDEHPGIPKDILEDVKLIIGEWVGDDRKHVRKERKGSRDRQAMEELRTGNLVDKASDITEDESRKKLPADKNARIITVWRNKAGGILITRHTYSWATTESYEKLCHAYAETPQEQGLPAERIGGFGSTLIRSLSERVTIMAIPSQLITRITNRQITKASGQRQRMMYRMPVAAVYIPPGGVSREESTFVFDLEDEEQV